jgi:hypothetical protein
MLPKRSHHHGERHFARPSENWNDFGLLGGRGYRHGARLERHGGGRRGQLFDHGELRFVLLHSIAEKPRHGYELIKSDGKKLCALTELGAAFLQENQPKVDAVFCVWRRHAARGDGPAPQIVRAVEKLRLVLRPRLSRGSLTEEQARAVAAALDGASTAVARV